MQVFLEFDRMSGRFKPSWRGNGTPITQSSDGAADDLVTWSNVDILAKLFTFPRSSLRFWSKVWETGLLAVSAGRSVPSAALGRRGLRKRKGWTVELMAPVRAPELVVPANSPL